MNAVSRIRKQEVNVYGRDSRMNVVSLALIGMLLPACAAAQLPNQPIASHRTSAPKGVASSADTVAYLHRAWVHRGRQWLTQTTGIRWDEKTGLWKIDPQWRYADSSTASEAYYAEYALRGALNLADVTHDSRLLDELANFYSTYLPRFRSLGELRGLASVRASTSLLDGQGEDDARVLPWLEGTKRGVRIRECTLCTSQFLHPAAKLIRLIASTPPSNRTAAMNLFVQQYAPLIVNDQLRRLILQAKPTGWGKLAATDTNLLARWQRLTRERGKRQPSYEEAVLDTDLWLVATTAEMLGAIHADSVLLNQSRANVQSLRQIFATGYRLIAANASPAVEVMDSRGARVQRISFFDGDYRNHPDFAYAGDTTPLFPLGTPPQRALTSWDISHIYRLPVLLRSVDDNKAALNVAIAGLIPVDAVVNQYVYRAFNRDLGKPLLHNFFDGTDGWYRVGYAGRNNFGYPPSRFCVAASATRPCLSPSGFFGWGLLRRTNSDLDALGRAVLKLASSKRPEDVQFRDRYYQAFGERFTTRNDDGTESYPILLFAMLADRL